MKTRILSLIAIFTIAATIPGMARQRIQIEAVNNDISYYLDLKAISSIFGDSRDLEDFEQRINDYDSRISNLDLNNDGDVDYLRVIESSENNTNLVVIQAILDRDVYQDVATIVVERDRYRRSYVQVIGDPYIYGANYIIEPVYYRTPLIYSWFWGTSYHRWNSPYYWGYYPRYYNYRRPLEINIYLSHVHGYVNYNHGYNYSSSWHSRSAYRMYNSVSRNDYSVRYPERSYSKRNTEYSNRYEMDKRRNSDYVRTAERSGSVSRSANSNRTSNDDVYNRSTRTATDSRSISGNRSGENTRVAEPTRSTRTETTQPTRESNSGSRNVYTPSQSNSRSVDASSTEKRVTESRSNYDTRNSNENVRSARPATESKNVERKSVERSSSSQRVSTPAATTRNESPRSSSKSSETKRSSSNDSKRNENSGRR